MTHRPAPIPLDEAARLDALRQMQVLDTGSESSFEDMVDLVQDRFRTPIALISLVDELRQWFKARRGLEVCETSRDASFCAHAILSSAPLAVHDAKLDVRFNDNPLVLGPPYIRAYLGAPLVTREGKRLGAICAIDTEPRTWSEEDKGFIERCARLTARSLSNRMALFDQDRKLFIESALDRSEARYRSIVAAMIEGLVIQGPTGAIMDSNPSAARILGLSEDQLYGRTSLDPRWRAITPDGADLPGEMHPAMIALRTGEPQFGFVMGVHRPDGEKRWILVNAQPVDDANCKTVRQVATTFVDITEQREHEIQLENAVMRAQAAEKAKVAFVNAMSHEVRTPLNGMLSVTQNLLSQDAYEVERTRKKIGLLHRSGLALKAIVDDALDIGLVANDRLDLSCSIYSPFEALDDAGKLYESLARSKGLHFQSQIHVDPEMYVQGDEGRVKQVVHNLLSNAVKFTTSGSVSVSAMVETIGETSELVVAVRDTGIGVPPAFASRLGASFARADNVVEARAEGAGLGLFLSRAIAAKMGGSLEYQPNPGGGSIFLFRKPLRIGNAPATTAEVFDNDRELAPLKILVAEDNPINREIIMLFLEPFDAKLTFATDGQAALDEAKTLQFDLILMDLQLPVMNGLDAVEQLRAWEIERQTKRTPIICLSASTKEAAFQSINDAGADAFVGKPIDACELIDAIQNIVVMEGAV